MDDPMIAALATRIFEGVKSANADRRAHFVADLTALSFLIEKGLATHEEVSRRLQLVQRSLPADYQEADVSQRIEFLSRVLSVVYGPKTRGWTPTVIQGGLDPGQMSDPTQPKT